ncbi:MAG: insulinase family protein [Sphingorhabdus sp.]
MQFKITKGAMRPVSMIAIAIALAATTPVLAQTVDKQNTSQTTTTKTEANGWGIATNDLMPDTAVRYGILPNGMKYALRRNETPKSAASVRLTIDAGRMAEIEGESGLAHFLEHMAFRGSTNIPDGELLKKLERLGLAFGADTNAETGPDYTRYKLELPRTDDEMLDAALMIMRETAGEMALTNDAIDKERGVILAEAPTRDSPGIRNLQAYLNNAAPQSNAGKGVFTDSQDDIKNALPKTVRAFYERNYRPELTTLAIVGDFDVDAVEEKIKARFADWRGKGSAAGSGNAFGKVDADQAIRFGNFANPGVVEAVELVRIKPAEPFENTADEVRDGFLSQLWQIALGKRLDQLSRAAESRVTATAVGASPLFRSAYNLSFTAVVKDGDWQSAAKFSEQEYRRMAEHGLGKDELESAVQQLGAALQSAAQTESSRPHDYLATVLSDNALNRTFAVAPSSDLAIFEAYKAQITPEMVNAEFKKDWGSGPNYIHLASKLPVENFASLAAATLDESKSIAIAPLAEAKVVKFAYANFGKAGRIATDKQNAELGFRAIQFRNGVMLNIKKTDFEPGNVHFSVRIGSGLAGQKSVTMGLPFFMDTMSGQDGLAAHSFDELQGVIAGRKVKLGLSAKQREFGSSGTVSPQDLEFQMQLLAATTTAYGYRAETDQSWQSYAPVIEDQLKSSPMAVFQSKVFGVLASDDPRISNADVDGLSDRNMAELKAWLQPELQSGPIEISLVGDVDEAAAVKAIADTFGALPKRGKAKPPITLAFPTDLTPRTLTHKGKDDQAIILLNWPAGDDSDQRSTAARELLGGVLQTEMRAVLREKLGATYTPEAVSIPSNAFPGYGMFLTLVTTTPENMDVVKAELLAIIARLRDEGTTEDALLRVRQPILERFAAQERSNGSWLNAISDAQSKPERLGRRAKRTEIWSSITPADIQKAAQDYLVADKALEIRIVSEAVAAKAPAAE